MQHAARVMDVDVVVVPVDENGRMTGDALRATLDEHSGDNLFAIVATGGTTNYGVVDDIKGAVAVANHFPTPKYHGVVITLFMFSFSE